MVNEVSPVKASLRRRVQVNLVSSRDPARGLEGNERHAEPNPGEKALHKPVSLGKRVNGVDGLAVEKAEIAGAGRDVDGAARLHEVIVEPLRPRLGQDSSLWFWTPATTS